LADVNCSFRNESVMPEMPMRACLNPLNCNLSALAKILKMTTDQYSTFQKFSDKESAIELEDLLK